MCIFGPKAGEQIEFLDYQTDFRNNHQNRNLNEVKLFYCIKFNFNPRTSE